MKKLTGYDIIPGYKKTASDRCRTVPKYHYSGITSKDGADSAKEEAFMAKKNKADCETDCANCKELENCSSATVTLTLDNDETLECSILTIYETDGKEYIALLPLNDNGVNDSGEVFLYRFRQENGEPVLENIEDDDEYEAASDGFDEWLDSMEYDEMVSEEDEDL